VTVRRPYLYKAVLWAGFLWLGIFLAAPPWEQGPPGASFGLWGVRLSSHALAAEAKEPQRPAAANPPADGSIPDKASQNPMNNLIRLLAGGLLAGVLWSMFFGYPFYTYWPDRPWPLGLLDLSVAATFCYLAYLAISSAVRGRRKPPPPPRPAFLKDPKAPPLTVSVSEAAEPGVKDIAAADPGFDLAAFSAFAYQVIKRLHAAWNLQDLDALKAEVGEALLEYLAMGLMILNLREEISRLEDVHLERLELTAAGREGDKEFISLAVEGQVTDYTLQKHSYKLVSGSLTYPATLRELWRFERRGSQEPWKLTDVQDH
jgi:predicted lipid-binding transport protein (Tim44 family)